jgi:indolepyruvate ferredoxin oxidoreductase beta subunit
MKMVYNVLLLGTGGQGIITLSKILATAAMSKNLKVIVTQKKGLAQRGGSVVAQVRIGDVYSPLIPKYSANSLLSMDMNETFGYIDYINKDTILMINTKIINDDAFLSKKNKVKKEKIKQLQESIKNNIFLIDAELKTKQEGMEKAANLYLLGVLFGLDNRINSFIKKDDVISSIKKNLKRNTELNIELFNKGIQFIQDKQMSYN